MQHQEVTLAFSHQKLFLFLNTSHFHKPQMLELNLDLFLPVSLRATSAWNTPVLLSVCVCVWFPLYLLSATVSSSSFCRISIQRGVFPSPRSISTSFFLTFVSHFDLMFFISDSQRIELSDFFVRFSFRLSPAVSLPPVFFFHFRLFPFSFFLHLFSQFTGSPRFSVVQREAVEENNPNPAHSRGFRR